MYTKEQLNLLFERIVKEIDISETLFDKAETAYKDLGKWIDKETPKYQINIYAQGSFALGTVVKPLSDTDDYDLDLVCEFAEQYELTAQALKNDVVKPLLLRYKKVKNNLEEKRRCWHVEYEDLPNFHMDVVPAVDRTNYIDITDHNEVNNQYCYIGSNPKGYIEWFFSRMEKRRQAIRETYMAQNRLIIKEQADVEAIKEYKLKTSLQKTIQLLKRHRDIAFAGEEDSLKPVSIIVTTLAAQLYNNEDNIVDALTTILGNAETYIQSHRVNGQYRVDNPSYSGENFADKWNKHPERAKEFINWIQQAKKDLLKDQLYTFNRIQMAENIKKSLGSLAGDRVFNQIAKEEHDAIKSGQTKVNPTTGIISASGSITIQRNHHYGTGAS